MIRSLLTHLTSEKALTAACVVALCSPLVGEGVHYIGMNPFDDGAIAYGTGALVSYADPSPAVSSHAGDGHLSQVQP